MAEPVALGVPMKGEIGKDELVVDVLLIAKIVDAEGETSLVQMASHSLRTWEAAGMALALTDSLRQGMRAMFVEDDDDG